MKNYPSPVRYLQRIAFSILILGSIDTSAAPTSADVFPDGTPLSAWFLDKTKIDVSKLGPKYSIAEHGAVADGKTLNTEAIQNLIDKVATTGGGVIVVPPGTFLSGSIYFKPGTHLHLEKDAVLKGSNNFSDYVQYASPTESKSLRQKPALVSALNVPGFTITGEGTIDGNGFKFWEAYWQKVKAEVKAKKDAKSAGITLEVVDKPKTTPSRPRLVMVAHSDNVTVQDVHLKDSAVWTSHYYRCDNLRILDATITAPRGPVKAPSSDGIDIDFCTNVVIRGCYISVCDDAIALKGGKGPDANKVPSNGPNNNLLIEDCTFGFCYSALTCGSESIHNRNILFRNITVKNPKEVFHLKMRPDTPQIYEFITIENVQGFAKSFMRIQPYTENFDLEGHESQPPSIARDITLRNISLELEEVADFKLSESDQLGQFTFENITLKATDPSVNLSVFDTVTITNFTINGQPVEYTKKGDAR